jgi:hypothetical protein
VLAVLCEASCELVPQAAAIIAATIRNAAEAMAEVFMVASLDAKRSHLQSQLRINLMTPPSLVDQAQLRSAGRVTVAVGASELRPGSFELQARIRQMSAPP